MITTALITAMLICAAAILMQWGPLTAKSAKRTVPVKRSQPAQIYEVPPPLLGASAAETNTDAHAAPTGSDADADWRAR